MKYLILSISLISSLFLGCKSDNGTTTEAEQIAIDGSSTVYPITEAIAEEYRQVDSRQRITIGVSGTGGGFKKFARGETVISDASRSIKASEIQSCNENGVTYIELEVAYDGLAVVANPANNWMNEITVSELKKIWEPDAQGKITKWNQIRAEWPDKEFSLLGPGTASGTFDYFTEAVVGESGASRGDYMPSEDDNVLVQGVAGDQYALAFFGLAYYEENADKLKLVAVNNGNGAVLPSLESVKTGSYAPLSRPLFIYVNSEGARRPEVVKFVEFYLQNAAKVVGDVGYIPLSSEEYEQQLTKFREWVGQNASVPSN